MKALPVINEQNISFDFVSLNDFAQPIYLDNNATTQVDTDAISAMIRAMEVEYANPSAMHTAGIKARELIENARADVASFLGCESNEIIFTSGATESINAMINSVLVTQYPRNHFITCVTEHGATLNKLKEVENKVGYKVFYLDVDNHGRFDIKQLKQFCDKEPHKVNLISIMAANNETGTIHENLNEAISIAHEYGALFHIDAVQIAGKMELPPFIKMGTDFLSISGHKMTAPKGVGILYIKNGTEFSPTILGGAHENNKRAGTENVPGIVGLGAVCKKSKVFDKKIKELHDLFIKLLLEKIPTCTINGGGVPGTINVGFKHVHRESMVVKMSNYGLYASTGSACAFGIRPSHVLKSMNVPIEYIHGSIRFSMSKYTTKDEVLRGIDIIIKSYNEIRNISFGIIK